VGRAVIDDGSLATSIRRGFPFDDCMSWWLRGRARAWVWGGPWFESGRWRSSFYFFYFLFLGVILSAECIGDGLNHLNFHQAAVSMVSVGTIINVVSGLSHSNRDLKIYTSRLCWTLNAMVMIRITSTFNRRRCPWCPWGPSSTSSRDFPIHIET